MVTVVIPAYNEEKWVAQAIQSVIAQTMKQWELVVVDDGSSDSTGAIIDQFAKEDPRLKAVHTKNRGTLLARSRGVREATTERITFLDADDTLEPNALEWLLQHDEGTVSVVEGGVWRCTPIGHYALRGDFSGLLTIEEFVDGLLMGDFVPTMCAKLFRRQDLLGMEQLIDPEININEELLMLVGSLNLNGQIYINKGQHIYNYNYRHNRPARAGVMNFRGWVKLVEGMRPLVNDSEAFFLYRLHRLYDCCIARGAMFSRFHPEVKRLIADSKRYALNAKEKHIVWLLYSRMARKLAAKRSAQAVPSTGVYISVVMATYNATPATLRKAIDSVVKQSFRDWELVIVDDASTDSTPELIRSYAAVDPRVRLIRSSVNHGQGGARLQGIASAKGEYVTFIDQDDLLSPDALRELWAQAHDSQSDIVIMGSRKLSPRGWVSIPHFYPSRFFTKAIYTTNELLPHLLRRAGMPCTQWGVLYRRAFIDLEEHQPEGAGEDWIFNYRVMLHPGKVTWIDFQGYRWRMGGQSTLPYPELWQWNLQSYQRMLQLLELAPADRQPTYRLNLDQGLVNDFLDKVAQGLRGRHRRGLNRFIENALDNPMLTEAMNSAGNDVSYQSAITQGREWKRRHRLFYKVMNLIKHL
ncbi:MAG: glycosyltransferase [Bacteroidales bacterium]|nr:glycosyltransferase [Bacteroidales bacterium]